MESLTQANAPLFQGYLQDASFYKGKAEQVFFPASEEEVASLVREANRTGIPLTVAGAGTGLTGARVPAGGWVLSTEKMNRILAIHTDADGSKGQAVVQPGVTLEALERALSEKGLFYPPNPGEKKASVGGTVATNASGSRSFLYGPTRAHVRRLKLILPNGEPLECARGQSREAGGEFLIGLSGGASVKVPLPRYAMPEVKNAAGYYARPGMDLIDLFIGSEGTLGIVTEIELEVLRTPPAIFGGILFFHSEEDAFLFSKQARALHPRVLEFFDSMSLTLLLKKYPQIPHEAKSALYVEQETYPSETEGCRSRWTSEASSFRAIVRPGWLSADPAKQADFRTFRYNLPVAVNERVAKNGFRKVATDAAVPEKNSQKMFDFYLSVLQGSEIDYCLWGHIGENHLHANLLPTTEEEFKQALEVYAAIAKKAVSLGGTVSAEHGIGKIRIPYLEMMVGPEGLKEMARVKKALDPNGILNPGTLIPAELLKEC
ncbi:MAG: FAD-binding oxidoreductase [Candidatus Omnitrophica bacterium]|nr:FAD-binding oxidoreductase [Candidatus Omnitrophota bacterium]